MYRAVQEWLWRKQGQMKEREKSNEEMGCRSYDEGG